MNAKLMAALIVFLFSMSSLFYVVPSGLAQENNSSFKLLNLPGGTFNSTLNVVVSQSLNQYYEGLSHRALSDVDFSKFVTPYAVKPIADALRQVYSDNEDFANGVLMLVHQIPYEETVAPFYPAETLLRNRGDCDMFSFLAASILKAGGLDVVLLHYLTKEHMNIGVHLDRVPRDAQREVGSFKYSGVMYYVAECTTSDWVNGWRVGECPPDLKGAEMAVILLENVERTAPGQVSASFQKLENTTLRVNVSPFLTTEGSTVSVNGQISPAVQNQNITLFCSVNGGEWVAIGSIVTGADGRFLYDWKSEVLGQVNVRASWGGNEKYAGSVSGNQKTIILSGYFVALVGAAFAAVIICVVAFLASNNSRRRRSPEKPIRVSLDV
jgi:hypothetical protein